MTDTNVRELRLLVQYKGQLLRLCKLIFTNNDASIYLVPYAPLGKYFFGTNEFNEGQVKKTFSFKTQLSSDVNQIPHLSIHETGQVHAYVNSIRTRSLQIPPLTKLRGQHVASVLADTFDGLVPFGEKPKNTGTKQDLVFKIEEPLESGRLALYINGKEPSFGDDCPVTLTLNRPSLSEPIYLGIRPWPQTAMSLERSNTGVMVIAGWDPIITLTTSSAPFLFIRGE